MIWWLWTLKCWLLSCVWLFVTPWTVAHQAPLSMEFSRQEYWSGLPFLLQGIFPTLGSNLGLPHCRQIFYHLSHKGSIEDKQPTEKGSQRWSWQAEFLSFWIFPDSSQTPLHDPGPGGWFPPAWVRHVTVSTWSWSYSQHVVDGCRESPMAYSSPPSLTWE